jgi:hypothetical protein
MATLPGLAIVKILCDLIEKFAQQKISNLTNLMGFYPQNKETKTAKFFFDFPNGQ